MTRILVCGAGDYGFVHNALNEVNTIYGPVSCVIHSNHPQALAWQQAVAVVQVTKHLPIEEDLRDGHLAGDRCRDKMFAARPHYVVVFKTAEKHAFTPPTEKRAKWEYIMLRAQALGIPVLTYTAEHRSLLRKDSTVKSDHPPTGSTRRSGGDTATVAA